MKSRLLGAVCVCVISLVSMSANAALIGRLEATPGAGDYQAYYDDQLKITWMADANVIPFPVVWDRATSWAASLTLGGVSGWRLPSADANGDQAPIVDCSTASATECLDNENGYNFYFNGVSFATPDPFNVQPRVYWSSTATPFNNPVRAIILSYSNGVQSAHDLVTSNWAWAVHDGDPFAPIPIPPAVWLFGAGLLALIGMVKRKAA